MSLYLFVSLCLVRVLQAYIFLPFVKNLITEMFCKVTKKDYYYYYYYYFFCNTKNKININTC